MIDRTRTASMLAGGALLGLLFDVETALAEIVESDVGAQPGTTETTHLVTSSDEVKRAVVGLLCIAGAAGVLFFFYWYKTGQQARERFARQFQGRHAVGVPSRRRSRRSRA